MVKKVGVIGGVAVTAGAMGVAPAHAAEADAIGRGNGDELYDGIIEFAAHTPSWVQSLGALFTKAALLIYAVLFLLAWWRARGRGPGNEREVAVAILAPLATGAAYVVSEVFKAFVHEDRPCRGLRGAATVLECPEAGDWSFPSNHATIAAAAAIGLIFAWRRLWPWVVGIALLMAFSRVFVGVHYPHDVFVGLLLGAVVAAVAVQSATGLATGLVRRFREHPLWGGLLTAKSPSAHASRHVRPGNRGRSPELRQTAQTPTEWRTEPMPPVADAHRNRPVHHDGYGDPRGPASAQPGQASSAEHGQPAWPAGQETWPTGQEPGAWPGQGQQGYHRR